MDTVRRRRFSTTSTDGAERRARFRGGAGRLRQGGARPRDSCAGTPDPDGIACADRAGVDRRASDASGVAQTTHRATASEVSHRENRALVKLLGLELKKIKSVAEAGSKVDFVALVDAHELDPGSWRTPQGLRDPDRGRPPPRPLALEGAPSRGPAAGRRATKRRSSLLEYLDELRAAGSRRRGGPQASPFGPHARPEVMDTDDFDTPARAVPTSSAAADRRGPRPRPLAGPHPAGLIAPSAMDVIAASTLRRWSSGATSRGAGVGFVSEAERDTIAQAADFVRLVAEDIDTVRRLRGVVGDKYHRGLAPHASSPSVDPAVGAGAGVRARTTRASRPTAAAGGTRAASASP